MSTDKLLTTIAGSTSTSQSPPLFSIGLIADVQYANIDDRWNYTRTALRRYRQALTLTRNAVQCWNDASTCLHSMRPSMIVHLGDIIDGLNKRHAYSKQATSAIMEAFSKFKPNNTFTYTHAAQQSEREQKQKKKKKSLTRDSWISYPHFHTVLGNHELYNFNRRDLVQYVYAPNDNCLEFYYAMQPRKGFKFIFMDSFLVTIHGWGHLTETEKEKEEESTSTSTSTSVTTTSEQDNNNKNNNNCSSSGGCSGHSGDCIIEDNDDDNDDSENKLDEEHKDKDKDQEGKHIQEQLKYKQLAHACLSVNPNSDHNNSQGLRGDLKR